MLKTTLDKPRLDSLLSQNDLCQSWLAVYPQTGEKRFVKTANPDSGMDQRTAGMILSKGFDLQRRIAFSRIITANRKYSDAGKVFYEYPYFDSNAWTALTPELFLKYSDTILIEICLLVDLLHLRDLVHCDLKLNNFLVKMSGDTPRVVLTDLDFLSESGNTPGARVFGSPDHIAPEILANDRVLAQTDNYSLGVALRQLVDYGQQQSDDSRSPLTSRLSKIDALADLLTAEEPLHRPYDLLKALKENDAVESSRVDEAFRRLLPMQLMPALRQIRKTGLSEDNFLRKTVIDPHRILGIVRELTPDLTSVYRSHPPSAVRIFKWIMQAASIDRYGDFWYLGLDDEQLKVIFGQVDECLNRYAPERPSSRFMATDDVESMVAAADEYRQTHQLHRAFLMLRMALERGEPVSKDNPEQRVAILRRLADLARELNRLSEAAAYYQELADLTPTHSGVDLDVLYELTSALSNLGDIEQASRVMERGQEESRAQGDLRHELIFLINDAWFRGLRGDYGQSDQILESVIQTAAQHQYADLVIRAHYARGISFWRKGHFLQAEKHLTQGFELVRKHNLYSTSVKLISSLAMLYHELGESSRAIRFGKLAMKQLSESSGGNTLRFLAINIACAYSRLGEHRMADTWVMKLFGTGPVDSYRRQVAEFYSNDAFLKRNRGDYDAASIAFHRARDLQDSSVLPRSVSKTNQNLAEIAMFQGLHEQCREYLERARNISEDIGDEATLAELELIDVCNDVYNGGSGSKLDALSQLVAKLHRCHSRYYTAQAIFHLLVNSDPAGMPAVAKLAEPLLEVTQDSRVPMYRALEPLINQASLPERDELGWIRTLKDAYRILENGGEKFPAMVVCRRIAESYLAQSKYKLSRKFSDQAIKLALAIRNNRVADDMTKAAKESTATSPDISRMIQSVHGVSEVFKSIKDYRGSLEKVIKFAVDQTGAERGVLLMKSDQSNDLRVAAFVNCDEDSLNDIKDFSSTIPLEVARTVDPLIIENAIADKRTKNYKSIVVHNILSVICLPISIDDRVLGVLYLDHHTIPALFDKEDVTYVSSVANLMAVMITTIQSYRDISIVNRQLVEDVSRGRDKRKFITSDASVLELFGKLPEIARTHAPILIVGESGTGKEILCEMIHELSLRHERPLVKLNCAAIASTLIESELFGVASHVATDVKERDGKFSTADGGTLLLDEIGDMPLEIQAKVLRAVENQQFEKVGSNKPIHTDIRFVCATNRNIQKMAERGEFRQDLYYRINTITIEIPPLRERLGDIPVLIDYFIGLFSTQGRVPRFATEVLEVLLAYSWPGNVRELKNFIERCCILYPGEKLDLNRLPAEIRGKVSDSATHKMAAESTEKARIRRALLKHEWNQSRASVDLGIPLSTLRRKIKKYKITRTI